MHNYEQFRHNLTERISFISSAERIRSMAERINGRTAVLIIQIITTNNSGSIFMNEFLLFPLLNYSLKNSFYGRTNLRGTFFAGGCLELFGGHKSLFGAAPITTGRLQTPNNDTPPWLQKKNPRCEKSHLLSGGLASGGAIKAPLKSLNKVECWSEGLQKVPQLVPYNAARR